jgi:hypothetical protein
MKLWSTILILILVAGILSGCGGGNAPSVGEQESSAQGLESSVASTGYSSEALDVSYEGALPAGNQLALGTFELEETEDAISAEQAETLLPLWQAIQGGSLQSDAETNAVLKQIEGAMTSEQLAAIAAMRLTVEDIGPWMQERGVNFRSPPGAEGGQNPFGMPGDVSEEERAAMRATVQAGGGASGTSGGVSEEERAAMRATAEAGGMTFGDSRGPDGASSGQLAMMAAQVVELLTARAAQ